MADLIKRLTAREFLAAVGLIAYLFLVTIGGYAVPDEGKAVIIPAIIIGAGWRLVQKNGE